MDKELVISNIKDVKRKFDIHKFLSTKYLKIYVLCIVVIIAFILYLNIGNEKEVKSTSNATYVSTLEYCKEIELKLENILSQIQGAGNVTVMISLDGSPELVYASDSDTKTSSNANGTTTTTSSNLIVINGSDKGALILKENLPKVKGVIVVSSGADNISIKLDMLNAISTLLDLSTDQINILKGI